MIWWFFMRNCKHMHCELNNGIFFRETCVNDAKFVWLLWATNGLGQMLAGQDLMKFWGTMLIQTVKFHISCSHTFYILLTIIFMIWAQHSRDLWCQHCHLEPGCAVVRVHPHRFSNWKALVFLSNDTTWMCLDFLLREAMASNGKSHEHGQVWSGAGKTQDIDVCSIVGQSWRLIDSNMICSQDELMLKDECILVNYMDEAIIEVCSGLHDVKQFSDSGGWPQQQVQLSQVCPWATAWTLAQVLMLSRISCCWCLGCQNARNSPWMVVDWLRHRAFSVLLFDHENRLLFASQLVFSQLNNQLHHPLVGSGTCWGCSRELKARSPSLWFGPTPVWRQNASAACASRAYA